MALNRFYEKLSKDSRVTFVKWIVAIFATSLFTFCFTLIKNHKHSMVIKEKQEEIETLRVNLKSANDKILVMQGQIEKLIDNQIKFDALEDQFANPRILKDLNGNVLSINEAYYLDFMRPFGFKRIDYKRDVDFWGVSFSKKIRSIEREAIEKDRKITFDFKGNLPFKPYPTISTLVTINPIRDRYGRFFMIEVSIFKNYK